jgi:hypothetical protein
MPIYNISNTQNYIQWVGWELKLRGVVRECIHVVCLDEHIRNEGGNIAHTPLTLSGTID